MNIAQAKNQIKTTVDGYLTQDETGAYVIPAEAQRPLFLLGAPGIGKTAIVGQVASELGIGLVSYSMTHHTRQSALGLPLIVRRDYGEESFDVSEYTMSEIIAAIYDYRERTGRARGILFLDEINCVSETLYPSMLQFLQFKTFGRHRVPDGWVVVCAGNPPEYNKSVHDFDVVTLDRLRTIRVEADLDAWIAYAVASGVHPAITSYLEVKPNHFYSVESTPSGKSFVTARGWDDLSRVMKLFEAKGQPVDRDLIGQFIQDEDIAARFAQYYALFSKYRSDYQISSILEGRAPEAIVERARAARLDERLALVRLVLDALSARFSDAVEAERVVAAVRDVLRDRKGSIVSGASARDELEAVAGDLAREAKRRVKAGAATDRDVRCDRLVAARLQGLAAACDQRRALSGPDAFAAIQEAYDEDVARFRSQVETASSQLDCAFDFIEHAFSDGRELAAFVAELTARPAASQFIGMFGSEAYYRRNGGVLPRAQRDGLLERIEKLDLDAVASASAERAAAERAEAGCGGCCGC